MHLVWLGRCFLPRLSVGCVANAEIKRGAPMAPRKRANAPQNSPEAVAAQKRREDKAGRVVQLTQGGRLSRFGDFEERKSKNAARLFEDTSCNG